MKFATIQLAANSILLKTAMQAEMWLSLWGGTDDSMFLALGKHRRQDGEPYLLPNAFPAVAVVDANIKDYCSLCLL